MAKLILHIGGHRTGSTSIQAALHAARKRLRRLGVLYPETGRVTIAHHSLANAVRGSGVAGFEETPALTSSLEALRCEVDASGCETVFISSEEFIRTCEMKAAAVGQLLSLFSEVRVVCFLRHQAPLLESSYKFSALWDVTATTEGFAEYVRHNTIGDHLAYRDIEPLFKSARSDTRIDFVSFAAAQRSGSLVRYFFEIAGIANAYSGEVRTNESLGRSATLALLLRNRGELHDSLGRGAFVRFARKLFPQERHSLFSPTLLEQVDSRFHASNDELAPRFGFNLNDELESFRKKHELVGADLSEKDRELLDSGMKRRNRFPFIALARDYIPRISLSR